MAQSLFYVFSVLEDMLVHVLGLIAAVLQSLLPRVTQALDDWGQGRAPLPEKSNPAPNSAQHRSFESESGEHRAPPGLRKVRWASSAVQP